MVVSVLMNREWLSLHPKNGPVAAQITTVSIARMKAIGDPVHASTSRANVENQPENLSIQALEIHRFLARLRPRGVVLLPRFRPILFRVPYPSRSARAPVNPFLRADALSARSAFATLVPLGITISNR